MKPDTPGEDRRVETPRRDDVERAHLVDPNDRTYAIARYDPPAEFAELVRRFWVPVWHVPPGQVAEQQVLQYPVALVVVSSDYARFYGVVRGLSRTTLHGNGFAVGAMLRPAAGTLLAGDSMRRFSDRFVDIEEVPGLAGHDLARRVRAQLSADPSDPGRQRAACDEMLAVFARTLPVDDEGRLVNEVVRYVEHDPQVLRVEDVCQRFGLPERALQRLTAKRLGLTPKWLIRRRRLHEAADRLRDNEIRLADVAAELGYADQAHFSRDWRAATGMTPREFAARFFPGSAR